MGVGQNSFGICLREGMGVDQDLFRFADFYSLSAEQGDAVGQYRFGRCLEESIGIARYLVRAADFHRLSAESGNADGHFILVDALKRDLC
jgi:TPR repeat protein